MQIHKQWIFGSPNGNCFQCCVSAVTGIPIQKVPNLCKYNNWWSRLIKFLNFYNLVPYNFIYSEDNIIFCHRVNIPYILSGISPRGKFWHSIVVYKDKIYDPHFTNCGVKTKEEQMIIVPKNRFYINEDNKVVCRYLL